jgi:hypothetical protein
MAVVQVGVDASKVGTLDRDRVEVRGAFEDVRMSTKLRLDRYLDFWRFFYCKGNPTCTEGSLRLVGGIQRTI